MNEENSFSEDQPENLEQKEEAASDSVDAPQESVAESTASEDETGSLNKDPLLEDSESNAEKPDAAKDNAADGTGGGEKPDSDPRRILDALESDEAGDAAASASIQGDSGADDIPGKDNPISFKEVLVEPEQSDGGDDDLITDAMHRLDEMLKTIKEKRSAGSE